MDNNFIQLSNPLLDEIILNESKYNNTIYVKGDIELETQLIFCRQLRKLAEKELNKKPEERNHIKIRIASGGGSQSAMFAMISYMEYLQEQGIIMETYAEGFAASAASKILAAGSKGYRYITRYGSVLIHQMMVTEFGTRTLQERRKSLEEEEKIWNTIKNILVKHTKLTEKEIFDYTDKNIDLIYSPQECIEKSIVDHII